MFTACFNNSFYLSLNVPLKVYLSISIKHVRNEMPERHGILSGYGVAVRLALRAFTQSPEGLFTPSEAIFVMLRAPPFKMPVPHRRM